MSKRVDMKEKDWEPFLLYHDPYHDNWCVILEHPNDKDNFIISFKGEYNDCYIVQSSLNNLIKEHWNHREIELRQIIRAEDSDVP